MTPQLLARVRWNNVGIALLALGALVLVVAWPRLGPGVPEIPADPVVPAAPAATPSAPVSGDAEVRRAEGPVRGSARVRRRPAGSGRPHRRVSADPRISGKRRHSPRRASRAASPSPAAAPVAAPPAPVHAPAPPAPAAAEFGFE